MAVGGDSDAPSIPWPLNENLEFLGQEVGQQLFQKDFCVVQSLLSPKVAGDALDEAKKLGDFKRLVKELEVCYLGSDIGSEKVAWLQPDDPRNEVTTALQSCDRVLTKLASGLYLECANLGFLPDGRSDALLRMPCRSKADRQEMLREQEKLNARLVRAGRVEDHIDFLQSRKVCSILQVTGSAKVVLHHRETKIAELLLQSGQILVFRHDRLSFAYEGIASEVLPSCLQSWLLSTGFSAELQAAAGNLAEADLAMGVMSGPLSPVNPKTGKTVSIKAVDCMLAGNGVSPDLYWAMLSAGTDGCRHLSSLRWDPVTYYEADKDLALGKYYSNHGGFVMEEYLMGFDSGFFGFSESQASLMDPIQRNSLEVGYSILLKAGWNRHRLRDANIGVYVGNCGTDWVTHKQPIEFLDGNGEISSLDYMAATSAHVTSTRLSYTFGMRGPISSSDTACSSSLVATGEAHNAMRSVDPGQGASTCSGTEHALVLGTNALLGPFSWIGLCGPKMLSVKGRCFTFDYGADGFGRGEGTSGLFAEVTHEEPVERLAIFCGTCINQDGRSASMTAPHGPSQQECIRASLKEANVTPSDIRVAELHGTGTALGDPIEVGALRGVMKDRKGPIMKTSAKSNLAHGEANAGMAGLVKCVLMLGHGTVAPNVHFCSLNPHLDLNGYPCQISDQMLELGTTSGYAGVSSFGFGGTNARADIWGKAQAGQRKAHKLDLNMLENVYVRCPRCLGGMEWKSGCAEPSRRPKGQGYGRSRASCVRDEFDSYEVCSLCYQGSYAYGAPPPVEEPLPAGSVFIKGTWTAFSKFEEMTEKDGAFHFQLRMGETRCERFYLAVNKKEDQAIFPWHSSGEADVRVKGPCKMKDGHYFFIDGRDDEWPEGSLVLVTFWTEGPDNERKIRWQRQVEEGGPKEMPSFQHSYQVRGSLTQLKMVQMKATRGLRNVFEYSTRFGLQNYETFHFVRDNDPAQTIYPARTLPKSTSVPVRGPDAFGTANFFAVSGRQGERLQLRLEVADGHIVVSASVVSSVRTWHSQEGRKSRRYYVAGTWAERGILMSQDSDNPDRYWAQMTMASRSRRAEFQIWIDEDPHRAIFPEYPSANSGGCMVAGPGVSDNKFAIDGYPGTSFQICLDLKSSNKWQKVTWTKLPDQAALMP